MIFLTRLCGWCLVLVLSLVVIWESLLISQAPSYSGTKLVKGIGSEVNVYRDESGVPHIIAKDANSAYFALGYVVAQDRLFQMEIIRRLSQGRLAEILGKDLLPIDRMFRTLMLTSWANSYANSQEKIAPEAWVNLDHYLEGVNAFLEEGNLPLEYTILNIPVQKFERKDALTSLAYMGFSFAEGIKTDSLYSILAEKFPDRNIQDLFPRYDFENGSAIQENQPSAPLLSGLMPNKAEDSLDHERQSSSKELTNSSLNITKSSSTKSQVQNFPNSEIESATNKSYGLESFVTAFQEAIVNLPPVEGSNSWVLSGTRTESGRAILCNDPHIGYSNPGTWYEAHLVYPGMNVYGYYLAGVPYPLVGNTDTKAWGLTMLENDDIDLYSETLSADGKQYLHKGQWKDLEIIQEPIQVKSEEVDQFAVRKTIHGPIYSDFVKGYKGNPVSLYWVFHHKNSPLLDVLHKALYSKTKTEMRNAVAMVTAPGLNFSYIDKEGDIGWWGAGRFPIRNRSTNSRKILDGVSGLDDVVDLLPFASNPQLENPKNGIIATANNLPSEIARPRLGKLEGNWQPSDRFNRITKFLSSKARFSREDMEKLILETESDSSHKNMEVYISQLDLKSESILSLSKEDQTLAKEAIRILSEWNSDARQDSLGTTVYYVLTYHIMKNLVQDEMGEELMLVYGSTAESLNAYKHLVQKKEHPLWDNQDTDHIENRDDILNLSLAQSIVYLKENVSKSPSLWAWKKLYSIEFMHPIGMKKPMNLLFNIGPFPTNGTQEVVNNIKSHLLDGTWKVKSGPSTRRIVSFDDLDDNSTILPSGNSGNLASPFYEDQALPYLKGEFRKTHFSEESIKEHSKYHMILLE